MMEVEATNVTTEAAVLNVYQTGATARTSIVTCVKLDPNVPYEEANDHWTEMT